MNDDSQFNEFTDEDVIQYAVECVGQGGTIPSELEPRLEALGVYEIILEVQPHVS